MWALRLRPTCTGPHWSRAAAKMLGNQTSSFSTSDDSLQVVPENNNKSNAPALKFKPTKERNIFAEYRKQKKDHAQDMRLARMARPHTFSKKYKKRQRRQKEREMKGGPYTGPGRYAAPNPFTEDQIGEVANQFVNVKQFYTEVFGTLRDSLPFRVTSPVVKKQLLKQQNPMLLVSDIVSGKAEDSVQNHNQLMRVFSAHDDLERVEQVFRKMESAKNESLRPNEHSVTHLLFAASQASSPDRALELLHECDEKGYPVSLPAITAVMSAVKKTGDLESCRRLVESRVVGRNLKADNHLVTSMLHGYIEQGEYEKGVDFYRALMLDRNEETGLRDADLDVVTLKAILRLHALRGQTDVAVQVLEWAVEGHEIHYARPEQVRDLYHEGIRAVSRSYQHAELAFDMFAEMKGLTVPNGQSYGQMLHICKVLGDAPRALNLWNEMIESGMEPTESLYNKMIEVYGGVLWQLQRKKKMFKSAPDTIDESEDRTILVPRSEVIDLVEQLKLYPDDAGITSAGNITWDKKKHGKHLFDSPQQELEILHSSSPGGYFGYDEDDEDYLELESSATQDLVEPTPEMIKLRSITEAEDNHDLTPEESFKVANDALTEHLARLRSMQDSGEDGEGLLEGAHNDLLEGAREDPLEGAHEDPLEGAHKDVLQLTGEPQHKDGGEELGPTAQVDGQATDDALQVVDDALDTTEKEPLPPIDVNLIPLHEMFESKPYYDMSYFREENPGALAATAISSAEKLVEQMHEFDMHVDVHTFNALLSVYCSGYRTQRAEELWKKQQEMGVEANVQSYWIMLKMLCRVKQLDRAEELFSEAQDKFEYLKPKVYGVMVDLYARRKSVDDAIELVEKCDAMGITLAEKWIRLARIRYREQGHKKPHPLLGLDPQRPPTPAQRKKQRKREELERRFPKKERRKMKKRHPNAHIPFLAIGQEYH